MLHNNFIDIEVEMERDPFPCLIISCVLSWTCVYAASPKPGLYCRLKVLLILCLHQSYNLVLHSTCWPLKQSALPFQLGWIFFLLGLSILIKVTHYFKLKLLKLNHVEILDCLKFIVLSSAVHILKKEKEVYREH